MIISARIDVTKIDKARLYKGEKGTYLDIVLIENRDGPDQYGNDFMVVQQVTKEERAQRIKGNIMGNIMGNGKQIGGSNEPPTVKTPPRPRPAPARPIPDDDDDCPI